MANELIKYNDLNIKLYEYINFVVWQDSKEQIINKWLKPICIYGKDKSIFYHISNERDCGWYIDKESILQILQNNAPKGYKEKWQNEFDFILKELKNYIAKYKEPQCNN
ncbi:hypothetical protein B2H94_11015 [Clostridium sporogenes]|uniref:Uncharacterized protein n=1 Tax=Clostridium sporogenes TaxID=1509 RepID=A0ABD6RPC7_CLOSG|nr:hypothetical protein [Clostridium sporogenes]MDU5011891.1 hypothetical protein [Clostridium botulinum]MDU5117092.1 hypothetical protein [Clostridium botulinum]OSB16714.1 hypothetical protein B2H94_11015 [Clostridium sporogenes]